MESGQTCQQIIRKAASEVIKEEGRRQRNDWFGEESKEVTQRKNGAYKKIIKKHYTRKNLEEYKELRRQEKMVDKMKKKLFHENVMKEIGKLTLGMQQGGVTN